MKAVRVPTLFKFGFALLLLLSSFAALPTPAEANCSQTVPIYFHYSDSAKTQLCGTCVRWCDGYFECSGDFDPTDCPYTRYGGQVYCPC